jgi:hypothetical protein
MDIEKIKEKIKESYDLATESKSGGRISYSQYSKFAKCPKSWELGYAKNLRTKDPSVHTVFGTAFHETVQEYSTKFMSTDDNFIDFNYHSYLRERLLENYIKDKEGIDHFTTPEELHEFWEDGIKTIKEFVDNRHIYIDSKRYDLLGIEVPLFIKAIDEGYDVNMLAFIDIVLYDRYKDVIKLIDIKTSTSGWNNNMRKNKLKQAQLILYKHFFSKSYGVEFEKIELEFLICKRKLDYGTDRVSAFSPESYGDLMSEVISDLENFVKYCFNADGSYNLNNTYHAISGGRNENCKYCEFKDREDLCPKKERIKQLSD